MRNLHTWEVPEVAKAMAAMDEVDTRFGGGPFEMTLGPVPLYSFEELIGYLIPGEVGWEYAPYEGPIVKATYAAPATHTDTAG